MAKKLDKPEDRLRLAGQADTFLDATKPGRAGSNGSAHEDQASFDPSVFEGKSAGVVDAINWVAENLTAGDTKPETAPSAVAWNMLTWAKSSPAATERFWDNMVGKLIPRRSSLEDSDKVSDDGRQLFGLLEDVRTMRAEAITETALAKAALMVDVEEAVREARNTVERGH